MCHPSFASVYLSRSFAKGKNKVKSGIKIIAVNDQELGELFEVEKLKEDFSKPISHMVKMYMEQLSIRSAAGAIEGIPVKYDGNTYTVQDLAEIGRKGTKEVILEMDAFVDAIPSVITALSNSALGLNPSQQGSSIIIPIPKVTREYREKLAKGAKLCFTSTKDAIKKVQAKYIRVVDDNETLSVDFKANLKTQLTYLASKTIAEAELIYKNKEKELLSSE
ncbi:UNVERIFIED_CONTAM: hypothetical protein PYX00_001540 [Menopon gallinae]